MNRAPLVTEYEHVQPYSLHTYIKFLECLCVVINMNDVISPSKMSVKNTRRSRVFSGIFLVEMASFMFLSQYRDTKAIFHLFYQITKIFSSFRDVIHVSVL